MVEFCYTPSVSALTFAQYVQSQTIGSMQTSQLGTVRKQHLMTYAAPDEVPDVFTMEGSLPPTNWLLDL
jgi:hypothetical protein